MILTGESIGGELASWFGNNEDSDLLGDEMGEYSEYM